MTSEVKKGLFNDKWSWLLWWKIDSKELQRQVEEYRTLKITQSARGIGFLLCIGSAVLAVILNTISSMGLSLFDILPLPILGFLIYRGHRWAMILSMLLWTVSKISFICNIISTKEYSSYVAGIGQQLIWWTVYMHAFYTAYRIEALRNKEIGVAKEVA